MLNQLFYFLLVFFLLTNLFLIGRTFWVKYRSRFQARKIQNRYDLYSEMADRITEGVPPDKIRISPRLPMDREAVILLVSRRFDRLSIADRAKIGKKLESLGFVDLFQKESQAGQPVKAGTAAMVLAALGNDKEVTRTKNLLGSTDETLRLVAAKALGKLAVFLLETDRKADAEPIIEVLVSLLERPEIIPLRRLQEIILEVGPACIPYLTIALHSSHEIARARSAEILGTLKDPATAPLIMDLLTDPLEDVRARAITALGELKNPLATLSLAGLLKDPSWVIRSQAAKALGNIGDPRGVWPLQSALTDHHWWVRYDAGYALSQMGRQGFNILVETLHSPDKFARERVIEVLEETRHVDRWIQDLDSDNTKLRNQATIYLTSLLKAGGISPLVRAILTVRQTKTALALTRIWQSFLLFTLNKLRDREESNQIWALEQLEKLTGQGAFDYLHQLRKFENPRIITLLDEIDTLTTLLHQEVESRKKSRDQEIKSRARAINW